MNSGPKFTTEDEALAYLLERRLRGETYPCGLCGHWHVKVTT